MQLMFFNTHSYLAFTVSHDFLSKVHDFGKKTSGSFDPSDEDRRQAGQLCQQLVLTAQFIDGDVEAISEAFAALLNMSQDHDFSAKTECLVYGFLSDDIEDVTKYMVGAMDNQAFQEHINFHKALAGCTVHGLVGQA
jgi:hypothetical protein